MILAGVDPGSVTGVVILEVPDTLAFAGARWLRGETFFPSKAKGLTEVARDRRMFRQMQEFFQQEKVDAVAIECAAESKMLYRGQRRQRTETSFRSGCYYALAMLAALEGGCAVTAYPAVSSKARGPGWMGKSPRKVIVPRLVQLLRAVGAPPELQMLNSDGELVQHHLADALGVLAHHINDQRLLRAAS